MKEMNREMELNMEELEQVNGGWLVCIIVGASSTPQAHLCYKDGLSTTEDKGVDDFIANACIWGLGIGLGANR